MKITTGQFNDSYFPIMDGVGMTAHNYARWLNEKYCTSVVVAPKVRDYEDHVPYKVYRFNSILLPGMNPYRVGLPLIDVKFKKKIKKVRFDLVHAHCPFNSGQLALNLSKKLKIPFVTTFHTKYRDDFKKVVNNDLIIDFLMNFTLDFYNAADLVLVPNKSTGVTLQEYGYKGNYEIMPNGTDMVVPDKLKLLNYRNKGLNKIKAGPNEFVLLFVGQHRWEKNIKLIIDSLKQLKSQGKSFKMVFVGEGYASTDMIKLVKKYGLQEQVIFLGVLTDRNELQHIYAAADLFLFPSIYDNSPLVMQEAAAFNVPSVVVRNSSSSESILDGVNGFIIDNDVADLTNKISDLMKDQISIKIAGEGARKSIYHPWE
jgi:1,2-diacylglycerol 3-alpha-glucosyltransferase